MWKKNAQGVNMFNSIYLDNGATTMLDPKVLEEMMPYFSKIYGNASSVHSFGFNAKEALTHARQIIADSINAQPEEIIFTSGGTESNNFAIKGIAFANKKKGNHIITTSIEHKSVLRSCKCLEEQGFTVTYLAVDNEGFVHPEDLEKAITKKTILVSIMQANNEVGTIQNLKALGEICAKHKIYFHTDACQSYTKTPLDVKKMHLDLVTINSHKINGPKGVGALYCKKGTKISPLMHGGGHEFGQRAGTENIPGIVGFAKAVQIGSKTKHLKKMAKLRDQLIAGLENLEGAKLNGPRGDKRLVNNVNFSFKGLEGSAIGGYLDRKFISSSTGSACSEASEKESYVLTEMGLTTKEARGSLRLTLSRFTEEKDITKTIKVLSSIISKMRKKSPLGKLMNKVFKDE